MSFEAVFSLALVAGLGATAVGLYIALRRGHVDSAAMALGRGQFQRALELADTSRAAERQNLYVAAVAAKHRLEWELAADLLHRILATDDDGEAWLELGLLSTYGGQFDEASRCLQRGLSARADLLESLTLHGAYLLLRRGELAAARLRFEEIEVSLETKLRTDLGTDEPLFSEWFLQISALWRAFGKETKATWAREVGERSCGDSRLVEVI